MLFGLSGMAAAAGTVGDSYGGRSMMVHVPGSLPAPGSRALVVVLHGGLGNAQHMESSLGMDGVADKDGFVVAYLNGTPAARMFGADRLAWNSGGCCGQPSAARVDDVGYIKGAVDYIVGKYGIDRSRVFAMGHSNGAMMTQRMMCETDVFAASVPVSGPLTLPTESCPAARGKRILAIQGADDQNVPVAGGRGGKGVARFDFPSQAHTRQVFVNSGASYTFESVPGADHPYPHIDAAVRQTEGTTIAEKAARFFGLSK
jgi:polyhydroxybutyrate depolymerase